MMIGNETVTTIDNICMYVHLIVQLGGPNWDVKVGRRDSRTASLSGANNIPPPTSGLANLTSLFAAQGLSQKDMVALSGAYYLNHQWLITMFSKQTNLVCQQHQVIIIWLCIYILLEGTMTNGSDSYVLTWETNHSLGPSHIIKQPWKDLINYSLVDWWKT